MDRDEREIRELVTAWMEHTRAGRPDKVLELMTEDAVFLQPGRAPMIGKAAFAESLKNASKGPVAFDGKSEIREVRIMGEWAFMWTHLILTLRAPGDAPMMRTGHTLTVLRKENGHWKLARDANLLGPPAPAAQA
jgi:uncharacterized protein (TIGR02246 family)